MGCLSDHQGLSANTKDVNEKYRKNIPCNAPFSQSVGDHQLPDEPTRIPHVGAPMLKKSLTMLMAS